jgi:hypothetical protein
MKVYRSAPVRFLNKQIDWDSDALVWTLHTSTYAPNLDTHQFVSDLTNELSTGGGYTAGTTSGGGLAIASPTMTYTAANSWTVQRANSTTYAAGDVVRPATGNGFLYMAAVGGASGGSIPTYPTVIGTTVADGAVTWECIGSGITVFGCSDPSWSSFTAGPCRYAVLSDRSSGANATNPLVGYVDFVTDKTGGGLTFTVQLHTALRAFAIAAP